MFHSFPKRVTSKQRQLFSHGNKDAPVDSAHVRRTKATVKRPMSFIPHIKRLTDQSHTNVAHSITWRFCSNRIAFLFLFPFLKRISSMILFVHDRNLAFCACQQARRCSRFVSHKIWRPRSLLLMIASVWGLDRELGTGIVRLKSVLGDVSKITEGPTMGPVIHLISHIQSNSRPWRQISHQGTGTVSGQGQSQG